MIPSGIGGRPPIRVESSRERRERDAQLLRRMPEIANAGHHIENVFLFDGAPMTSPKVAFSPPAGRPRGPSSWKNSKNGVRVELHPDARAELRSAALWFAGEPTLERHWFKSKGQQADCPGDFEVNVTGPSFVEIDKSRTEAGRQARDSEGSPTSRRIHVVHAGTVLRLAR